VEATCERRVWNERCTRTFEGLTCYQGSCSSGEYDQCFNEERYQCQREESVYGGLRYLYTYTHNVTLKLSEDLDLGNQVLKITTEADRGALEVTLNNSYSDNLLKYHIKRETNSTLITISPVMSKQLAETFKTVSLQNLSYDNGDISFDIKSGANLKDFIKVSSIHIEKNRIFSDKIVYQTPQRSYEKGGEIKPMGNDLGFMFTCKNSKIPCISKGKYDIYVTLDMGLTDYVLNVNQYLFLKKEIKGEVLKVRP
jgi:hypothetical protein